MTERDTEEVNSPFWNKGKWDNYIKPLLPEIGKGLSLVDMGCNSGLFLKYAEDMGFKAAGIDSDKGAVERGIKWRDENGGKYKIFMEKMEKCIDLLPVVDYTTLVNSHYYFEITSWLDYLEKLKFKTRYCIIVTAEKNHINRCWARADIGTIRKYFKDWDEVGFIDELPLTGNHPRRMWSLCFKSRYIDRVGIDTLDSSNHVQDSFYGQLDRGKEYDKTKYYWILERYRKKWSKEYLNNWVENKIGIYEDLKENGLKNPILVQDNLILDGNHRYAMMKTLGYKEIFIRKI